MISNEIYDLQKQVNIMSYNIAKYVNRWNLMAYMKVKQ